MAESDVMERIRAAERFIQQHYGTNRAFADAWNLSATQVSRALNPEKTTDRRLAPLESAMWRFHSEARDEADELEQMAGRLSELARELREREG